MEFLVRAATMALAVLASVFTVEDAPRAQAKPVPAMTQAAFAPAPQEFVFKCEKPGSVVIVRVLTAPEEPKSDPFMEWVRGTQKGSKPVANVPWYTRTEEFTLPTFDETAGVFEAIFAPAPDL